MGAISGRFKSTKPAAEVKQSAVKAAEPKTPAFFTPKASGEAALSIYHTDKGDLAVEFPSETMRDTFMRYIGGSKTLPDNLRGNIPAMNHLIFYPHKIISFTFQPQEMIRA